MSELRRQFAVLRQTPPRAAARLVFRKAVYRKVTMVRYEASVDACKPPPTDLRFEVRFLEPADHQRLVGTNPYLSAVDIERFSRQGATCIVAVAKERIVASSWMTRGATHVHELQRTVDVGPGEHFFSRSFVEPAHRGRSLSSHLMHAYARQQPASDVVWGLIYRWNIGSIRAAEKVGRRETGEYWTRTIFGVQFAGERRYPPRPATTLG